MSDVEGPCAPPGCAAIFVTQYPHNPSRVCRPALQLLRLLNAGKLPLFVAVTLRESPDGLGDCHEASRTLMAELIVAKEAARWKLAGGRVTHNAAEGEMDHSWLECDGWALDCANGKLLFEDRAAYRQSSKARDVVVRDAAAFRRWLRSMDPPPGATQPTDLA